MLSRTSQTGADALKSFWTPTCPEVGHWFDQVKFQEMYFCDVTTTIPKHQFRRESGAHSIRRWRTGVTKNVTLCHLFPSARSRLVCMMSRRIACWAFRDAPIRPKYGGWDIAQRPKLVKRTVGATPPFRRRNCTTSLWFFGDCREAPQYLVPSMRRCNNKSHKWRKLS